MGEPKIGVGWSLAGPVISVSDVLALFRRQLQVGPFVIISDLAEGMALDTAARHHEGSRPHLWPVHLGPYQQWIFKRTPKKGGFWIISCDNELALDSGSQRKNRAYVEMREPNESRTQRWRLREVPRRPGSWMIESVNDTRVLDVTEKPTTGTSPWMFDSGGWPQQRFKLVQSKGANSTWITASK